MNTSNFDKVCAFQRAIAQKMDVPTGVELARLRAKLMGEEYTETWDALARHTFRPDEGLADLAKELADLVYVVLGTAEAYGIPFDEVFDAVHTSNMAKVAHGAVVDGKLQKHEGYQAPDIAALLKAVEV